MMELGPQAKFAAVQGSTEVNGAGIRDSSDRAFSSWQSPASNPGKVQAIHINLGPVAFEGDRAALAWPDREEVVRGVRREDAQSVTPSEGEMDEERGVFVGLRRVSRLPLSVPVRLTLGSRSRSDTSSRPSRVPQYTLSERSRLSA